jgi:RNA polymerase sporulation-specific sigma factor
MKQVADLIEENEKLIYSIISKYPNKEDLIQIGKLAMAEAYQNFDDTRGTKFTTYAYPYILGAISKYVRENHNLKLDRDSYRLKAKIEKAKELLTQELMKVPNNQELSEYLSIPLETVDRLLNYQDCLSLDVEYNDVNLYDFTPSEEYDYDTLIALKDQLKSLEEPEITIMYSRYFEDKTQTEIANNLGLSQVDVSRREKKTLIKLRKTFN